MKLLRVVPESGQLVVRPRGPVEIPELIERDTVLAAMRLEQVEVRVRVAPD